MSDPRHRLVHGRDCSGIGKIRRPDKYDFDAKRPRRGDLGVAGVPAAVSGHDGVDRVCLHQGTLVLRAERSAPLEVDGIVEEPVRHPVDAADEIEVLGRPRECVDLLPPDGEKDPPSGAAERRNGLPYAINLAPAVAVGLRPWRTAKRKQTHAGLDRGGNRVSRHLFGEGMGRVDEEVDLLRLKPCRKTVDAAETADPHRHGMGYDLLDATGERHGDLVLALRRKPRGEFAGLRRATENEDAMDSRHVCP